MRQSYTLLSVSILGFHYLTFLLVLIPIPWHSCPVPPQTSLAELSFILQSSKQLHQILLFSSITARHSSSIKLLFCPPLPPINVLHSHCLTSKAPLPTQVPPQLFTDTQHGCNFSWLLYHVARQGGRECSVPSSARSSSFKKICVFKVSYIEKRQMVIAFV